MLRRYSVVWIAAVAALGASTALARDPGRLPQTTALPSATSAAFQARMETLWQAIVTDNPAAGASAFFPRSAYLQTKAVADPGADYRDRLLANYTADIRAAHRVVAGGGARFRRVIVPHEWAWIAPGYCVNRVGYWHAPGARLVYTQHGRLRSFGIYSLISWRGQWYVVHLGQWDDPGTVVEPAAGIGPFGLPGGC